MSFGHNLKSATQRDRDHYNLPRGGNYNYWPAHLCSAKCRKPVVFVASYQYVTGRQGRVGVAERFVCEEHGRKFAKKYGLTVPDPSIPGSTKSASQQRDEFVASAVDGLGSAIHGKP